MIPSHFNIAGSSAIGVVSSGNVNIGRDVNIVHSSPQDELEFEMFDVPRCITSFKGREKEMEELDSLLFNQHKRKLVICALPGFGKTELSKQYANRCVASKRVHRTFWIKAEHRNDLQTSFKTLKKIYRTFSEQVCLFIFDNATCRRDIYEYEPPSDNGNYLFLITSREKNWGSDINPVPIGPLSPESAVEIYKSFLNGNYREEDRSLYVELADVVGYIPLGLQITGAYIQQQMEVLENCFVLCEYIESLKLSQKDILDATIPSYSPNTYENSIYVAVSASLNKIQDMKGTHTPELALNILYICSYLDTDHIEFENLIEMSKCNEVLKTKENSKNEINVALNLLSNFLFINYKTGDFYIKIHRLIQDVVRLYLQSNTEIQSSCYTASLKYIFEIQNKFYYSSHCRYVMKYADDNVSLIYNFFKKHSFKSSEVLNKFILSLIAWGCCECLKNIIENDGKWTMKNIFNIVTFRKRTVSYKTILNLLLTYSLDINKPDSNKYTPLHISAMFWNLDAINILIKCNSNVIAKNCYGETALFCFIESACMRENVSMVEVNKILELLDFKNNKYVTDNTGYNLLFLAAALSNNTELLNLLVQYGFDVNSTNANQATPIHIAAFHSNLIALKFLTNHNADLNARDNEGNTALFYFVAGACKCENIDIAEVNEMLDLLELKNNIKITNNKGQNLLFNAAAFSNNTDILHLLVQRGFDVNSTDATQATPTHIAAFHSNLIALKFLVKLNADINIRDCDGDTALFNFIRGLYYRENINIDEVKVILNLLQCKQNKDITNNNNNTLLYSAAESCHEELVSLLITEYKFNVNHRNLLGNTPLINVMFNYDRFFPRSTLALIRIVKVLKSHGADVNIRNNYDVTPLQLVGVSGVPFLIPYLTETKE